MIYNFRFDRARRAEVLLRLVDNRILSQGWGGGETGGLRIDQDDFVSKCRQAYSLTSTRVPSNLVRLRFLSDGDILVTPHLPDNGQVSVHVVDGSFPDCYQYIENDPAHLNHGIRVRQSYGLDGNVSVYATLLSAWYGKLPWMRLPVLPISEHEDAFRGVVQQLSADPAASLAASRLDGFIASLRREARGLIRQRLNAISPHLGEISFESVCERLLASAGYRVTNRHQYDRAGGDADFRCVRTRADHSPFEDGESVLYVQVKKHAGTTDAWAVEQLLKMIAKEPTADGCVITLADGFTEAAVKLAVDNGICLMSGDTVCALLLRELVRD